MALPQGTTYISNPSQLAKYRENQLLRVGGKVYLRPQGQARIPEMGKGTPLGVKAPGSRSPNAPAIPGQVKAPGTPSTLPPEYQSIIDQLTKAYTGTQGATPPSFDQSGLYNEADAQAQGEAEFNPYFQTQLQRQLVPLQQGLQRNLGQIDANYANRNLLHSGGYLASQGLANQNYNTAAGQDTEANNQARLQAIAGYRNNAYNQAFSRYLTQLPKGQ